MLVEHEHSASAGDRRATAALTAPAARCRLRRHTTRRRTTTRRFTIHARPRRIARAIPRARPNISGSPRWRRRRPCGRRAGVRVGTDHKQPAKTAACDRPPSLLHRAKRGRRQRVPSPSKRLTRVSSCRRVVVSSCRAKRRRGAAVDKRLSAEETHSASASSGEIRAARRAGPRQASSDTPPITRAETASVGG